MELNHQVSAQLKHLRLSGVVETLEARQRQAIDAKWSYLDFLSRLLADEIERRAQKQLALRIRRSLVNTTKTLEGFDFNVNPPADPGLGQWRLSPAEAQCADLWPEWGREVASGAGLGPRSMPPGL
jgi:DNA replication protein DnaC